MEWWLLSPEELAKDDDARLAMQQAYFATFFSGTENMKVLNHIREMCFDSGSAELIEFYCAIRNNAGRSRITELDMIRAEADSILKADPSVALD